MTLRPPGVGVLVVEGEEDFGDMALVCVGCHPSPKARKPPGELAGRQSVCTSLSPLLEYSDPNSKSPGNGILNERGRIVERGGAKLGSLQMCLVFSLPFLSPT